MPNLTFPARFEFLDQIREFVAQVAREGGFNEKEIYSLQLAADEAATNIIEHAYEGVEDADFEVGCDMEDETFVITMRDNGKPFNPSNVRLPNLKADLSERKIGGLGVYLMRKLMDDVHYISNPRTGNLLTMTKRRG
jgi:serine/threonine-protein kinase RsbW